MIVYMLLNKETKTETYKIEKDLILIIIMISHFYLFHVSSCLVSVSIFLLNKFPHLLLFSSFPQLLGGLQLRELEAVKARVRASLQSVRVPR